MIMLELCSVGNGEIWGAYYNWGGLASLCKELDHLLEK